MVAARPLWDGPAVRGVRLQAAQMFDHGIRPVQVAGTQRLRVSTKPAYQWRRRRRAGSETALASKGPGGAGCWL
jgi:hypothetical protein